MKVDKRNLRRILYEVLLNEAPPKPGQEKADTEGSLNIKKISDTLGVDAGALKTAVNAARSGKRSSVHNAVLADVFVKLMNASPNDTVKVMNVLKAVSSDNEGQEKGK